MNPTANPFAPGAGTQPPELAGRERIIAEATVALGRVKLGRPSKSQMLLGLRGVGKTVLLNRIAAIALFVDEVQYLSETDLAALIVSVHKIVQKGLPFILFGAGLPQLAALAGEAKSYSERLFDYPEVGALAEDAAGEAIVAPVRREGVEITNDALTAIVRKTK